MNPIQRPSGEYWGDGPTAEGTIPAPSQEVLRTVGALAEGERRGRLRCRADAVRDELGEPSSRGTKDLRGQPLFLVHEEWRVTTKPGRLYFTFFQEPRTPFPLPPMRNAVKRAWRLADGVPVEVKTLDDRPALVVERPVVDPMATVVAVEIEGDRVER